MGIRGRFSYVYNELDTCEKDNLIKLNPDKTINFLDGGMVCSPPENDNGTWDLKEDSLYFSNSGSTTKIQSFDGKILILTGPVADNPGVNGTTTFERK